jgi:hypothetical protein
VFRDNVIGYSRPRSGDTVGIRASEAAKGLVTEGNVFRNVATPVAFEKTRDK